MADENILVVEDEGIVAADIRQSLTGLGYRVSGVTSTGEDAVRKAGETQPDLVLMDIILDGEMNGIEAARTIRDLYRIPVVYLTAHADEGTIERARTAEAFGYVTKPFNIAELRSAIEIALFKHKADERLYETKQWLATTLNCVADGVVATDAQGSITFINSAAERLTGWTQQESTGQLASKVLRLQDRITRKDLPHPTEFVLRENEVLSLPGAMLVALDGKDRIVDASAAPIRENDGLVSGVVIALHDVTERVRTEAALRQSEEMLRQSQKMEAVGRLAGGIAHDFNNMLTSILGFSTLVHDQLPEASEVRKDMEEVLLAVERAGELTKQLLALSRRRVIPGKPINLNVAIQKIIHILRRTVPEDIQIVANLDPAVGGVALDLTHVQQIIMNLALNARDAMPAGGKLTVSTSRATLDEAFCRTHAGIQPGLFAVITVADTGVGMSEKVRQQAFEPFFTTKDPARGTGLGLSIVYGLIRQHGGHIEMDSELNRGTQITMYLPHANAEPEVRPARPQEAMPKGTETILVVDDEATVLNLTVRVLKSLGYRTLVARDGSEALQVSDRHHEPIHLMVTDVVMPEMGGPQLAEIMERRRPDMKIIFTSGYTEQSLSSRVSHDARVPLIEKPFTPKTIAQQVRETLDQGKA
jgi:hypothetical protein